MNFCHYPSDHFLSNLKSLVEQNGLPGCRLYWSHTLNEGAADVTMEIDEGAGVFRMQMHRCKLLEAPQIRPCDSCCGHCDALHGRVLEPLGFASEIDLSECKQERCSATVTRRDALGWIGGPR